MNRLLGRFFGQTSANHVPSPLLPSATALTNNTDQEFISDSGNPYLHTKKRLFAIDTSANLPPLSLTNLLQQSELESKGKDGAPVYYYVKEINQPELSHSTAILYNDTIRYFLSSYNFAISYTNNCRIRREADDKAADNVRRMDGIDGSSFQIEFSKQQYTKDEGVMGESELLFKAICLDEKKGVAYLYGGSEFTHERKPTRYCLMFDLTKEHWSRIELEQPELLPALEGHSLILRQNALYIFGGLEGQAFVNKLCMIDLKNRTHKQIEAKNHGLIKARAYHTAQYIEKHDVMAVVCGKLRKGPNAPMTNEILLYHFNQNVFQIIDTDPSPFVKLPAVHVIHSTVISDTQMAFYGGCLTTNYNEDSDYDQHLIILNFKKKDRKGYELTTNVTMIDLEERRSSCYTTMAYHKELSSFFLFGSNQPQRKNCMTIYTMNLSHKDPVTHLDLSTHLQNTESPLLDVEILF